MRKSGIAFALTALLCGVGGANAADLSYKDPYYEAPLAPIWSGFYVGGHVGGLWNDKGENGYYKKNKWATEADWKEYEKFDFSSDEDDVSFLGGIHVGYNWQSDAKVFGVEADLSFADGMDYLASVRARLGYAMDSLLVYATAGVAFAGFDDKTVTADSKWHDRTVDISGDKEVGFVVGGGAEYKLASNMSVGLEGLYYFFGDSEDVDQWEWACKDRKIVHEDDNDLFVLRARLTYHFQPDSYEPLK